MKKAVAEDVLRLVSDVIGHVCGQNFALHQPQFSGNEWKYVKECIDTGWVSSAGIYVDEFERKLAEMTNTRAAVAVVNGTAALHICLKLSGVLSGDEVLAPSFTFVATANAINYCGAIPHFFDIEEQNLGLDVEKLREYLKLCTEKRGTHLHNRATGRRISALVVMHTFGHSVDLDAALALCREFGLELIEDAAESLGSFYKGRHTGGFGKISALSFNGNKVITTGGGGAILTNDEALAKLAKHITTTAKVPHPWEYYHDMVGYNYRLPNLNAALGCAQLEKLPVFLEQKRMLAEQYRKAFSSLAGVRFVEEPVFGTSNYWLNAVVFEHGAKSERDAFLKLSNAAGIGTRPSWTPMHQLKIYSECPRMDLSTTDSLARRLVNLPSSSNLIGGAFPDGKK